MSKLFVYIRCPPTMPTTIEVEVEELCTRTVARTPIITPATGFDRISFFLKISPADLPKKKFCMLSLSYCCLLNVQWQILHEYHEYIKDKFWLLWKWNSTVYPVKSYDFLIKKIKKIIICIQKGRKDKKIEMLTYSFTCYTWFNECFCLWNFKLLENICRFLFVFVVLWCCHID